MVNSSMGSGWLLDFNIRIERDTVSSLIDRSEEEALYRGSRYVRPYWLLIVCSIGGLFGAPLASWILWTEPELGVLTVAALAAIALVLGNFSGRVFGTLMKRRTVVAICAGAAIAAMGQVGGQIGWGFSAVGGAAVGFVHGVLSSRPAHTNVLWLPANLVFGAAAACFGVYLVSAGPAASMLPLVIVGGGTAAISFYVLILSFFSHYYTAAGGLRDLAQIYAHCDATLPKAIAHLTEAIRIDPGDAELYIMRGIAWSFSGEMEKAQADYRQVEAMRPMEIEPVMNHALDLARREEFDQSIEILRKLRDRAPRNALVVCNLGAILSRREDFAESVDCFDQAIALRPNYPRAYSNRAYSRAKLGQFHAALGDAEVALQQNPHSAMAYVHRGMAHAGLGDIDVAVEDYRTAIRIGGEIDAAERAAEGLQDLGFAA